MQSFGISFRAGSSLCRKWSSALQSCKRCSAVSFVSPQKLHVWSSTASRWYSELFVHRPPDIRMRKKLAALLLHVCNTAPSAWPEGLVAGEPSSWPEFSVPLLVSFASVSYPSHGWFSAGVSGCFINRHGGSDVNFFQFLVFRSCSLGCSGPGSHGSKHECGFEVL